MNAFDKAMNELDDKYSFLSSANQIVSSSDEKDKVEFHIFYICVTMLTSHSSMPMPSF